MSINFNEQTSEKERQRFIYKSNSLVERAFQIFEFNENKNDYVHVGDYTLINKEESREITENKIKNLVTLLNGGKDLINFSNLTDKRVLYTMVPEEESGDRTKIIFKDYDGSGVSKDNAVFTIRKGVLK